MVIRFNIPTMIGVINYSRIIFPPFMCDATRKLFQPICTTVGKEHQSPKYKIDYVPLDPVSDYVYIADLNTRLCVGLKTLPNLNFKLKFQTQTLISKTKVFPVLPGNP